MDNTNQLNETPFQILQMVIKSVVEDLKDAKSLSDLAYRVEINRLEYTLRKALEEVKVND